MLLQILPRTAQKESLHDCQSPARPTFNHEALREGRVFEPSSLVIPRSWVKRLSRQSDCRSSRPQNDSIEERDVIPDLSPDGRCLRALCSHKRLAPKAYRRPTITIPKAWAVCAPKGGHLQTQPPHEEPSHPRIVARQFAVPPEALVL